MNDIIKTKIIKIKDIATLLNIENFEMLVQYQKGHSIGQHIINNIVSELDINERMIVLDFDGIKACDSKCADEIVLELVSYILQNKKRRIVVVKNANEHVLNNVLATSMYREYKLSKSKKSKIAIPFFIKTDNDIKLVGGLEKKILEAYNIISGRAIVTARDLADKENIEINTASNRLKKLFEYNLLLRDCKIDNTGKFYIYQKFDFSNI